MPILLDDIDNSSFAAQDKTNPKFFSSALTGSGKKAGLLNQDLLPIKATSVDMGNPADDMPRKRRDTQSDITVSRIPVDTRLSSTYHSDTLTGTPALTRIPDDGQRFELSFQPVGRPAVTATKLVFSCHPQSVMIREDKSGADTSRDVVVHYRMQMTIFDDVTTSQYAEITDINSAALRHTALRHLHNEPLAVLEFTDSPVHTAREFVENTLRLNRFSANNLDDLDTWLQDYSVYEHIQALAEIWSSDEIAEHVNVVVDFAKTAFAAGNVAPMNTLAMQLRYLENYPVTLEAYKEIHAHMTAVLDPDSVSKLSKQNLNLLMSDTLNQLAAVKSQLSVPMAPAAAVTLPTHYSTQQRAAITTHEPLVMTQAGAGTGKSTVILERIKYLEACGVPADDITVLSFTNAAADNIKEKNPAIGSMTIAKMIIDIYGANHPTHKTSSADTVINALEIFYPNDGISEMLRQHLVNVDRNSVGAMTALNTFVEYNFDAIMTRLDRIRQTTLELQIIVCYQRIDSMIEPASVASRHLIIDEVQDNSIFEFIYVLRYVAKHLESLFIVGDASQTLYEFRSANPRALNTLESSGVFTTHQLSTNYRSGQEILDFANLTLQNLATNRNANIRLQANSLTASTEKSFTDAVTLDRRLAPKLTEFVANELGLIVRNTIAKNWVASRIANGERVCFLAYSRREVETMRKALMAAFPNENVASLISDRMNSTDIFSKYIRLYWNDVLQSPPHNAAYTVTQGIQNNLPKLTRNAGKPAVEKAIMGTVSQWWVTNAAVINSMVARVQGGSMSMNDFFDGLRDNMLDFEIQKNQEKLNVVKHRNQNRKQQNMTSDAKLLVSTIHGVKGLEFDHTVVLYKDESPMSEEARRMYYVAFTRAMRSTYVLAYGTKPNSVIENQYEQVVKALADRDAAVAQAAADAALAAAAAPAAGTPVAGTDPDADPDADQVITVTGPLDGSVPAADVSAAVFDDDGGCVSSAALDQVEDADSDGDDHSADPAGDVPVEAAQTAAV